MYSKDQGVTYIRQRAVRERNPSYRQPERPRMQVPANYSGHAIVDGEERPLGAPEDMGVDILSAELSIEDSPTPHFEGLPRVSELGSTQRRSPTAPLPVSFAEPEPERDAASRMEPPAAPRKSSLFDFSHFPFGHGIGGEELLILGLILFFLHESADCEERGDLDETVILLGLLLLLG